jgi:hypothetical protein
VGNGSVLNSFRASAAVKALQCIGLLDAERIKHCEVAVPNFLTLLGPSIRVRMFGDALMTAFNLVIPYVCDTQHAQIIGMCRAPHVALLRFLLRSVSSRVWRAFSNIHISCFVCCISLAPCRSLTYTSLSPPCAYIPHPAVPTPLSCAPHQPCAPPSLCRFLA